MTTAIPAESNLHLNADAIHPSYRCQQDRAKRFRHAAIIGTIDALYWGEAIESINNRDPPDVRNTE